MKAVIQVMSVLIVTTCFMPSLAYSQVPRTSAKTFMRAKLAHSEQILEALALADFNNIVRGANQLKLLSLDVNWQVRQTLDYRRHSADFRRSANLLIEAGEKRSIDSAVLAYFHLTQNCVSCHKYLRDTPGKP